MNKKRHGYIGKRMSKNAYRAHKNGEFPISSIDAKLLRAYKFNYSVAFFKWICKKGYIRPVSFHHTGAASKMTRFYSAKTIKYVAAKYNLLLLYDMYRGRINKSDAKRILGIKYVKISITESILSKSTADLTIDAVLYQNIYFISKNKWICRDEAQIEIIAEWEHEPSFKEWRNINKNAIVCKIIKFKNIKDIVKAYK